MSAAKHTPGPWVWQHWQDGQNTVAEQSTLGTIANIWTSGAGVDIDKANARLIAAAPELLQALVAMRDSRPSGVSLTAAEGVALDKCCAAIAKATGGAA